MRLRSSPLVSRCSSGSQYEPQITFSTFQPAPRNAASSSWMILPLPRTGPSRRWRLQLTTKTRLSSFSREAQRNRAQRLGLVHLPVAHERPDLAPRGVEQSPVVQVLHEPGLVDGHDRTEPHRHGGELPEVGHEPRVGVGREAFAVDLLAEPVETVFGDAAFEIGACVDARRRMALHEDQIASMGLVRRVPEVVEADVVERCGRREARDVAAELAREAVRLHHHRQRIPSDQRADTPFDGGVAGGMFGTRFRDGVDVGGVDRKRQAGAALARVLHQRGEDEVGALDAVAIDDGPERLDPVPGLDGVDVGRLRVGGHGALS